jgi:hypothetical protein
MDYWIEVSSIDQFKKARNSCVKCVVSNAFRISRSFVIAIEGLRKLETPSKNQITS